MGFKEQLTKLRKRNNITQIDLAETMNVKQYIISSWETGRSEPNISQIIKLSDIFSVPIDYLLDKQVIRTIDDDSFNRVIENINQDVNDDFTNEIKKIANSISDKKKEKLLIILKNLAEY